MKTHRFFLGANSYVKVECSEPAKVLLIDDKHYDRFCRESWADYYGGFFAYFPAIVEVPYDAIWNVVIDTHTSGRSLPVIKISFIAKGEQSELNDLSDCPEWLTHLG